MFSQKTISVRPKTPPQHISKSSSPYNQAPQHNNTLKSHADESTSKSHLTTVSNRTVKPWIDTPPVLLVYWDSGNLAVPQVSGPASRQCQCMSLINNFSNR